MLPTSPRSVALTTPMTRSSRYADTSSHLIHPQWWRSRVRVRIIIIIIIIIIMMHGWLVTSRNLPSRAGRSGRWSRSLEALSDLLMCGDGLMD